MRRSLARRLIAAPYITHMWYFHC